MHDGRCAAGPKDDSPPPWADYQNRGAIGPGAGFIGLAADAIVSIDSDHRIVMYNQRAEAVFGWSAAEVMGKPVEILLPKLFRGAHGQHLRTFGDGDVPARRMGQRMPALIGLRKNGEEFSAQAAISRLDTDGAKLLTVGLPDITKEQRRERERHVFAERGAAPAPNHHPL